MNNLLALTVHRITLFNTREKQKMYARLGEQLRGRAVSSSLLSRLLHRFDASSFQLLTGRSLRRGSWQPELWTEQAERDLLFLNSRADSQQPVFLLRLDDPGYPELLSAIYNAPYLLFACGSAEALNLPAIAVVGTRQPSRCGSRASRRIASELAEAGFAVVSGLARGIDAAAHQGALDAGGRTIAVLGTGIDRIYPHENRGLARKIIETGGLILSEYPPRTEPRRWNFPARNRVISGLAQGVVTAEAPQRSGALITADFALEQNRELMVLREGLFSGAGAGGRRLEAEGAAVVSRVADILRCLNGWYQDEEPRDDDGGGENTLYYRYADCDAGTVGKMRAEELRSEMNRGGLCV